MGVFITIISFCLHTHTILFSCPHKILLFICSYCTFIYSHKENIIRLPTYAFPNGKEKNHSLPRGSCKQLITHSLVRVCEGLRTEREGVKGWGQSGVVEVWGNRYRGQLVRGARGDRKRCNGCRWKCSEALQSCFGIDFSLHWSRTMCDDCIHKRLMTHFHSPQ